MRQTACSVCIVYLVVILHKKPAGVSPMMLLLNYEMLNHEISSGTL